MASRQRRLGTTWQADLFALFDLFDDPDFPAYDVLTAPAFRVPPSEHWVQLRLWDNEPSSTDTAPTVPC